MLMGQGQGICFLILILQTLTISYPTHLQAQDYTILSVLMVYKKIAIDFKNRISLNTLFSHPLCPLLRHNISHVSPSKWQIFPPWNNSFPSGLKEIPSPLQVTAENWTTLVSLKLLTNGAFPSPLLQKHWHGSVSVSPDFASSHWPKGSSMDESWGDCYLGWKNIQQKGQCVEIAKLGTALLLGT